MRAHELRVVEEKRQLDALLVGLVAFIEGGGLFNTLPVDERRRLYAQHRAMVTYSTILGERIAAFPPPPTETMTDTTKPAAPAAKIPPLFRVKSSSISEIGHADGALFVRFAAGSLYRYPGVSLDTYNAVRNAKSVGRALQLDVLAKHTGTLVPEADGA